MPSTTFDLRYAAELTIVLVKRDLRASYGHALLGALWVPLSALIQVLVLSFLFLRVVPLDVDDYPAFVFCGVAMWQLAMTSITRSVESFTTNRDLVRRPRFPTALLPVVAIGTATAGYVLGLPVLFGFLAVSGRLHPTALALPGVLVLAIGVLAGPALVFGSWNVRFRDIRHVVAAMLGVTFYLTPVFYDVARIPQGYRWIADVNPFAILVRMHRDVLYEGAMPSGQLFLSGLAAAIVSTSIGVAVFRRAEPNLADDL